MLDAPPGALKAVCMGAARTWRRAIHTPRKLIDDLIGEPAGEGPLPEAILLHSAPQGATADPKLEGRGCSIPVVGIQRLEHAADLGLV